jgi:hypothetical protein
VSTVVRCRDCEVEFLDPQPTFDEIKTIYTADYYRSWNMASGENDSVAMIKKRTFAKRLRDLRKFVSKGRILDVGTASGFFLEVAQAEGFEPYGVELSTYAGGIAARKFGADHIHLGVLETAPFRKVMGSGWTHYKLEHLFYFNPRSLEVLARAAGFRVALCKAADKAMNIEYLHSQLSEYRHPVLTSLSKLASAVARPVATRPIDLKMGEMVAILERENLVIA